MTFVSLPKAISIQDEAFYGCSKLTNAVLPSATSIGIRAFVQCGALASVSIPAVTSVGDDAFGSSYSLDVILTNEEMVFELDRVRSHYGLDNRVKILTPAKDEVERATLKVSYSSTIGEVDVCEAGYRLACAMHDLTPKEGPPVVREGEVAVSETELRAAKAEAVSVAGGVVTLAVNVCSNANLKVETKDWKPIELQPENVEVENGRIVITIPVDSRQGFMILQSGDAKVGR